MVDEGTLVAVALAVAPSLALLWYFHRSDRFREPRKVIWITFALGVGTCVPVLAVGHYIEGILPTTQSPYARAFFEAFILAAAIEELFKFLVLTIYSANTRAFDEPMDGVVYGVVASLGFATLENILYVSGGGLSTAIMRAFTAVPHHAFDGALMGSFVGLALAWHRRRVWLYMAGYGVAVLFHGLYDYPLMVTSHLAPAGLGPGTVLLGAVLPLAVAGLLLLQWWLVTRILRRFRAEQTATGMPDEEEPLVSERVDAVMDKVMRKTTGSVGGKILVIAGPIVLGLGGLLFLIAVVMGLRGAGAGESAATTLGLEQLGVLMSVAGAVGLVVGRRFQRSASG